MASYFVAKLPRSVRLPRFRGYLGKLVGRSRGQEP